MGGNYMSDATTNDPITDPIYYHTYDNASTHKRIILAHKNEYIIDKCALLQV